MATDAGDGGTASERWGTPPGQASNSPPSRGHPVGPARAQRGRRGAAEELAALLATCARSDAIEHVLHLEAPAAPCAAPGGRRAGRRCNDPARGPARGLPARPSGAPAARIGRRLLGRTAAACRRRGAAALLLTVDERSAGGQAFAEAVGARYRFSEYRMELARVPEDRPWPRSLSLRPATPDDAAAFAHVGAAAFGDPDEAARAGGVGAGMREPDHRYTLAELDGRPIGTLRVSAYGATVYLTAFGVLPALQGQGFGRQILTRTVRALAAEGWTRSGLRSTPRTGTRWGCTGRAGSGRSPATPTTRWTSPARVRGDRPALLPSPASPPASMQQKTSLLLHRTGAGARLRAA